MAFKNQPTIPHLDLLTPAIDKLHEMITYYKVITFDLDPCTNITISTPPPHNCLKKINIEILTPLPPTARGYYGLCSAPTVPWYRKMFLHMPSRKTENSNNKNYNFRNNWKTEDSINKNYNFRNNWTLTVYTTSTRRFTTYYSTIIQWLHPLKPIN